MARDMDTPDTAGKDMDMSDTRAVCVENGCIKPAKPGAKHCPRHAE